jgi:hypothetical protein
MVYGQTLDQGTKRLNDIGALTDLNDGVQNFFVLGSLGAVLVPEVDQFVQNFLIALGHQGADLAAGVFGGYMAADLNQPVEIDPAPFVQIIGLVGHKGKLFCRVIDKGSQLIPVPDGQGGGEQVIDLFLYFAGAGVENVKECFVFAVDIGHEVFRTLRKVQNGLEPDDLTARVLNGGILPGQQPQIVKLVRLEGSFTWHIGTTSLKISGYI